MQQTVTKSQIVPKGRRRGVSAIETARYVVTAWLVFWFVLVRRLFFGPRHPAWSFRKELATTLMRHSVRRINGLPAAEARARERATLIHHSHRSRVRHTHRVLAGLATEVFEAVQPASGRPTILYLHGGGYMLCSPATHRDLLSRIAAASGARVIAIDYRKAPVHPFPAAIDDCEHAYRDLLDEGVDPDTLFVAGDSAGGGLAIATLLRARAARLPLPRAAILLSPWVDLEHTGASIASNARYDYLLPEGLGLASRDYLQGANPRHPEASAIHADLRGLPPLLVQTGSAELFYAENLLFVERARAAGVSVTHEIEQGMVHVYAAFASYAPECQAAIARIGAFVRQFADAPRAADPALVDALG